MPEVVPIYLEGNTKTLSVAFTDSNGSAVDPTGVVFIAQAPDGTQTTYTYGTDAELVKDSTGNYHVNWKFTSSGDWWYSFEATGSTYPGYSEKRIKIRDSRISD